MPESTPTPEKSGIEATTRLCPDCGSQFMGDSHKDCASHGSTVKRSSSSKSRLDELPAEALPFSEDPGRQLNQYILVKQIGKGGMGAVWKAWDRKLTRWVAIKFLLASEDDDIIRFQREAKLAARLRHPNIAPIYEVGEAPATQAGQQPRHYLAMEFIDGQSMAGVELPLREAIELFVKVCQGVEAAHKGGVVHRDLKPQNIMLTSDRWPYVMDFGLAKALQTESSISVSGAIMGTPAYMPPEQAKGDLDAIDAQSDVYSLGATIYAVLTKKQPYNGKTAMEVLMKVCQEEFPPPRTLNAEIPPAVETIILKAMAKNKADRYPSAAALAEDLRRYLSDEAITARVPPTARAGARRGAGAWVVALLVLLGGGGAGAYYLFLREPNPPVARPPDAPPSPPDPGPPPVDEAKLRAEAWAAEWVKLRDRMDFDRWKPEDAALQADASNLLGRMAGEADPLLVGNVADWFESQARQAKGEADRLGKRERSAAQRIVAWCGAILQAGQGVEPLKTALGLAGQARALALPVADFKGLFTLKLAVGPYAEVSSVTRNGQPVAFPKATPAVLGNLEIGDYEIVLTHPQHGTRKVKLDSAGLKDGKTYQVSGLMKDPALQVRELP